LLYPPNLLEGTFCDVRSTKVLVALLPRLG
jgi:hypothetical protein